MTFWHLDLTVSLDWSARTESATESGGRKALVPRIWMDGAIFRRGAPLIRLVAPTLPWMKMLLDFHFRFAIICKWILLLIMIRLLFRKFGPIAVNNALLREIN